MAGIAIAAIGGGALAGWGASALGAGALGSVAAGIVGSNIIGGVLGGHAQSNASNNATQAQVAQSQAAIAEQRRQFDAYRALLEPYVKAGTGANGSLQGQQALLGLLGNDKQQEAINALSNSSRMGEMTRQGENSLLQNASATGGLRGGNTQAALALLRPRILNSLIDQQYTNLGGITSLSQNSATGVGNAGMQTGQNVANWMDQIGVGQAQNYLNQGQIQNQLYNLPGNLLMGLSGLGGSRRRNTQWIFQ